ncbi:uncharacterized protein [Musca autumnalis]|uniref:uncharacterized protein n=1 Tax=Musca autumnalis TaxID=221902 RepID=UPI003CF52E41
MQSVSTGSSMKLLLLHTLLLLFGRQTVTESLTQVLQTFQQKLDIYTLLVFGGNGTFDFWENSPGIIQQPRVIIGHEVANALRESQGERILSFINLDTNYMDYLEEILKPSLLFLHLQDILFYTNTTWIPEGEEWLWLFEWLWQQGFWRDYLEMRQVKISDFQGYTVKAAVGNNPPRVNAFFGDQNELQVSGFYGNTIEIFAKMYNITLEYVIMPNMSHYSILDCIQSVTDHVADVCTDAILWGTGIETTRPMYIVFSHLMVPYDEPLEKFEYFRMSFTRQVWFVIFITFLCTLMLLMLVEYKEYRRLSLINNLLTTFSSFICASFRLEHLSQNYRYGLETILIFSGFMISNYYLSILSSILLTKIYRREINSVEDVVSHNFSILTTDFQQWVLEVTDASPIIRKQTIVVSEEFAVENQRLLNPEFIYFGLDEELDFFLYQQKYLSHPRLKKLANEAVTTDIGEIPMRSYWPLRDILDNLWINLFDTGIYPRLYEEAFREGIHLKLIAFVPNEDLSVEPLSLEYFVLCGLILVAGYILGLVCFLIEIIVYKKVGKK